jgi:hypothetical protein
MLKNKKPKLKKQKKYKLQVVLNFCTHCKKQTKTLDEFFFCNDCKHNFGINNVQLH